MAVQQESSNGTGTGGSTGGDERRGFPRAAVVWSGNIAYDGGENGCVVLDVSASGARAQVRRPYNGPRRLTLNISRFGEFAADVVWRSRTAIGIRFLADPEMIAGVFGATLPAVGAYN